MVKRSLIAREASGNDLHQLVTAVVYDMILMDSNMPEMSGIEATVEIRKAGFKGPIIGMSGGGDDRGFVNAGAVDVLEKPVSGAELTKAIATALSVQASGVNSPGRRNSSSQRMPERISRDRSRSASIAPEPPVLMEAHSSGQIILPAHYTALGSASRHGSASVIISRQGPADAPTPNTNFANDVDVVLRWEKLLS